MNLAASPLQHALMVEDEHFYQDYFKGIFAKLGAAWNLHFADTGAQAVQFLKTLEHPLDLVLVDLGLPDMSGLELIKQAYALVPNTPIIVMTTFSNEENFIAAIRAGASGYLLKSEPEQALVASMEQVLQGNYPVSPMLARHLFRLSGSPVFKDPAVALNLSPREIELLGHLAAGLSYAICAERMRISMSTVQSHIRNVYRKLNVSNQTQAINKARASGVIT